MKLLVVMGGGTYQVMGIGVVDGVCIVIDWLPECWGGLC